MKDSERDALLIRLDTRMEAVHETIERIEKIEPRVSRLERWRSKITGALAVVGAALGLLSWELHK